MSELFNYSKAQNICKKCEHNLSKYGKPSACECCKIVAAFGGSKCMRSVKFGNSKPVEYVNEILLNTHDSKNIITKKMFLKY